jgi:hypothetical protein
MIVKPALAALLAAGLAVPEKPRLIFPNPAIVKPGNVEFSRHLLLGMPLTMGILAPGPGVGPYGISFRGVYQTNSTSFTSPSINIGPAYTDRIVLVGIYSHSSTTSSISVGGRSASNLVTSTYHDSWWKVIDVPGESVTVSGTGADAFRTLFVYTVTGISAGKAATLDPRSAAANNTNSTATTYSSSAIGDVFLAIGHKGGTGATDNWGTLGGTSGVVQTAQYRIGTAGSGYGGHGISPQQTTTGSKTIITSGSDSSKATSLAALRISL